MKVLKYADNFVYQRMMLWSTDQVTGKVQLVNALFCFLNGEKVTIHLLRFFSKELQIILFINRSHTPNSFIL